VLYLRISYLSLISLRYIDRTLNYLREILLFDVRQLLSYHTTFAIYCVTFRDSYASKSTALNRGDIAKLEQVMTKRLLMTENGL